MDVETGETLDGLDDKLTADSAGVSDHEVTSSDDEDLADKSGSPPEGLPSSCSPYVRHSPIRVDIATESYNGCDRIDDWKSCAICLEEMNKDMRRHVGCDCVLCEVCIEVSTYFIHKFEATLHLNYFYLLLMLCNFI